MIKTRILMSLIGIIAVLFIGFFSFFISSELVDTLTGKTTARAYILETVSENCTVNLQKGLNMVSFPCETGEFGLYEALLNEENETLDFNYIFIFNPLNTEKPWRSYNPSLPNWTIQGNINNLNRAYGYFIYMNKEDTYFKDGLRFGTTNIQLRKGWNLVGYPSATTTNVTEALSSISNHYSSVHSYQSVNGSLTWLDHFKEGDSTLEYLTPEYGYWIYANETVLWVVQW
jgi:hypothetical protein